MNETYISWLVNPNLNLIQHQVINKKTKKMISTSELPIESDNCFVHAAIKETLLLFLYQCELFHQFSLTLSQNLPY